MLDAHDNDVIPGCRRAGTPRHRGAPAARLLQGPGEDGLHIPHFGRPRYVVAGDFARVGEDGSITLLGRGSGCINTAGEKVYPEEVEEVLKTARAVHDAVVVGLPDERFGEAVVALVELEVGAQFDEAELDRPHEGDVSPATRRLDASLSSSGSQRLPNGKMDYPAMKAAAASAFGSQGRGSRSGSTKPSRDTGEARRVSE